MLMTNKGIVQCECEDESELLADMCTLIEFTARIATKIHGADMAQDVMSDLIARAIIHGQREVKKGVKDED